MSGFSGKGRRRLATVSASLALAVLVITAVATKDKLLEQWLLWELSSNDPEKQEAAATRLGAMGSVRAVPVLVEILREATWADEEESGSLSKMYSLRATRPSSQDSWPARAITAVGARAVPAIAEAIEDERWLFGDRSGMDEALQEAIEAMGPPASSPLMELLEARNPNTKRLAALVLRRLGHEPERALKALLEAHRAAWGIGEFRSTTERSRPRTSGDPEN